MQAQSHKDVVKNITTASQLEGELQLSQAQHGVAVLDIYNAEWGHCKALSDTFRRLHTDAGDLVHLRFFSIECNAVLESLRSPEDARAPMRPKGMEFSPETLSAFWGKMLEQRQNHSKPYFAFYKEGKMRSHLEGIDTPKICRIVQDLCKQQNAASEYITNPDVLQFWDSHFSPAENEIATAEFVRAARSLLSTTATELSGDDVAHMTAAVVQGETPDIVTASALQAFVGDSGTVRDALLAVVTARRSAAAAQAPPPPPEPQPEEAVEETVEAVDTPAASPEPAEEEGTAEQAGAEDGAAADPREELDEPVDTAAAEEMEEGDAEEEEKEPTAHEGEEEGEDAVAATHDASPADDADPYEELDEAPPSTAEAEAAPAEPQEVGAEHDEAVEEAVPSAAVDADAAAPADDAQTPSNSSPALHEDEAAAAPLAESPDPTDGVAESPNVTADQDESTVNQIFTNRWVTVSEGEMHVWNTVAALPLHYPQSTTLMADLSNDETPAREALPPSPETLPTLAEYLDAQGVAAADVNMMCIAADQKVGSESLSYGKLSLILMSCDAEVSKGLVPECELFLGELSAGTLLRQHQPLAFTALALSASEAYPDECFYYCLPEGTAGPFQSLQENDVFVLRALTPLNTAAPADGVVALRIFGLPKVIELATTDESDDTMVLSQWFARLRVGEVGADAITAHFVENVCDEEFQGFLAGYIPRLIEDENRLDKKQGEEAAVDDTAELGDEEAYEEGAEEEEEAGEEDGEEEEEDAAADDSAEL